MDFKSQVNQLRRNRDVIAGLGGFVSPERACWRPGEDRWSLLETVCHLRDIEAEDFRVEFEIILNRPGENWPNFDIEEWRTMRGYNREDYDTVLNEFLSERDHSLSWLDSLDDPDLEAVHRGKGKKGIPMKAGDVLSAWVVHDYGHIRQLALLRKEIQDEFESFKSDYSGFDYV